MQQPDPEVLECAGRKTFILLNCGGSFDGVGRFYQRADDERLSAQSDLLFDQLVGLNFPGLTVRQRRGDRLAAHRQDFQRGDVQVAVDSQRQGPWNRGRRHGEQVRPGRALGECPPLFNTEPVLFVDDRKPKPGNRHLLLQQGVRADDEIGFPVGDHLLNSRFDRPLQTADKQHHRDSAVSFAGQARVAYSVAWFTREGFSVQLVRNT